MTQRVFAVYKKTGLRPLSAGLIAIVIIASLFPFTPAFATTCVTSGLNVTITTNCIFDAGTYTFTGLLTINPGVTVTAQSNVGNGQVIIVSDNIRIDGTLSANGTGYTTSTCGATVGQGPGAATAGGAGGGYGGDGGFGSAATSLGRSNGSVTQPIDMGSSGSYSAGCFGGTTSTGGGAIKLVASSGTVIVAGTISANGTNPNVFAGGGAGGSVWIDTATLTGGGTITVNGGTGTGGSPDGGGGGGRIALYFTTDSATGTRTAYGGAKGSSGQNGGAGTIFVDDTDDASTNGTLIVDDNNLTSAAGTTQVSTLSQTYDFVTIKNGANYTVPNLFTFTLPSGGAVTTGNSGARPKITVNSGGTFNPNTASWSVEGLDVTDAGTINTVTSLTMSGADLTMSGTGTFASPLTTLNLNGFSNVTHNGVSPNFNLTSLAIPTLGSVTVGTTAPYYPFGSGLTTLNVTGRYTADTTARLFLDTLNVNSGGTVTHATNTSTTAKDRQLDIQATSTIRVNSGGAISANDKGFTESSCAGAGLGPGGGAANGAGGGYGGRGGFGSTSTSFGATYGSLTQPTDIGSAGGPASGCFGGVPSFGGGAIKLISAGTIIVAGTVSSNGNTATSVEGGGSGGSVWIDAPSGTLTGGGTISANGGAGTGGSNDGGGGGGRVALYYTTDSGTGTRSAYGGAKAISAQNGGAGTIYKKQTGVSTLGDLILDDNNLASAAGTAQVSTLSQTYDNVTIRNGANYTIPNLFTFTLPSGGVVTVSNSGARPKITVEAGGTFNPNTATWAIEGLDIADAGSITTLTSLTMSGGDLTLSGTGTFASALTTLNLNGFSNFTHNGVGPNLNLTSLSIPTLGSVMVTAVAPYYPFGSGFSTLNVTGRYTADHINRLFVDTLNVNSGGTVTHATNTSTTVKDRQLDIAATSTIRVNSGGSISVNDKGFGPGTCGGAGLGPGAGPGNGAGGGYGGRGGNGTSGTAFGATYGSVTQPIDIGSSGGYPSGCFGGTPSTGAGAIKLTSGGSVIVAGTVSANAGTPTAIVGGGAGGSVWIDTDTLSGGGTISANGGVGSSSGSGGGGGGRVALYFNADSGTSTRLAYGAAKGGGSSLNGGAGTVFTDDKDDALTNGNLTIDDNNLTNAAGTAQVTTASQTYDAIVIRNGGHYLIPSGFTLTWPTGSSTIFGGGTALPILTIQSGGTFNPPAAALTIDGLNVFHTGLFNTLTDLTVKNSTFTSSNTNFTAGLAALTVDSGGTYQSSASTTSLTVSGTITVKSGGLITSATNSNQHDNSINIVATNLDIQSGGSVNVNGKGFTSSEGTGQGTDGTTAGGGGHGGAGGNSSAGVTGGGTYGSNTQPTAIGSGGGADTQIGATSGGFGGGAIKLTLSGTLTLNGALSANGLTSSTTGHEAGGGAGGSIWFDVTSAIFNANVTAIGGAGASSGVPGGGGGGGGRIAGYYISLTGSGTSTVTGGAKGGSGAATAGANGSTFASVNPPVVTVTAPNGGQSFTGGEHTNITFTSIGSIDHYRISLSTDGGSSFSTVVTTSATGSPYDWAVTNVSTTQGRIKVEGMSVGDVSQASDVSDANFNITATGSSGGGGAGSDTTPSITLTQPNGGEQIPQNSTYSVFWTTHGSPITSVRLSYSADGGSSYNLITSSANPSAGFYNWSVPNIVAPSVLMKAEALGGTPASDTSDAPFAITGPPQTCTDDTWTCSDWSACPSGGGTQSRTCTMTSDCAGVTTPSPTTTQSCAPSGPSLNLTVPNGGERLASGQSTTIRWSSNGTISSVALAYSLDAGSTYTSIASNFSAGTGGFTWTVPVVSATNTQAMVKITGDALSDTSDAVFTITPPITTPAEQAAVNALGLKDPLLTMSDTSRSDELAFSFSAESQGASSKAAKKLFGIQDEDTGLWVVVATDVGTINPFPKTASADGRFFSAAKSLLSALVNDIFGFETAQAATAKKYALGKTPLYQTPASWGSGATLTNLDGTKTYALTVVQKPTSTTQPGVETWTASAATPKGEVSFDVSKKILTTTGDTNPDPDAVAPGTVLTYEFVLKNTGNRRAKYVTLIDVFPPDTTYAKGLVADGRGQTDAQDADVAYVADQNRQAVWNWYALEIGASHTANVKLKTKVLDGVMLQNSASVTAIMTAGGVSTGTSAPSISPTVSVLVKPRGPYCGDAKCNNDETSLSCVQDCPAPVCGNAKCETGETDQNCRQDCVGGPKAVCGNAKCEAPETSRTCAKDCPAAVCGDKVCGYLETASNCVLDCRPLGLSDDQWTIKINTYLKQQQSTQPPLPGASTGGRPPENPPPTAPGGTTTNPPGPGDTTATPPPEETAGDSFATSVGEALSDAASAVSDSIASAGTAISDTFIAFGDALTLGPEEMEQTRILDAVTNLTKDVPVLRDAVVVTRAAVKALRTNETVQVTNAAILTPAAASVAAVSATAAVGFAGFARYAMFLILQPISLLDRRKRKTYGTVYNVATKMPIDLATVRLLDATGQKAVATRVTDRQGRYLFLTPPGTYMLEVKKPGFDFPPKRTISGIADGPYDDLHVGGQVGTSEGLIAKNIPLEPVGDMRTNSAIMAAAGRFRFQWAVAAIGPGFALASYAVTPRWEQIVAVVFQIVLTLVFLRVMRKPRPKSWGVVHAPDGKPVHRAVVRVSESAYNKVLDAQVTDARGRYAFLAGQNRYYLTAEHAGYQTAKTETIDFTQAKEPAFIADDIELKPAA